MRDVWMDRSRSIGLLILRLGVGGYMVTHGWGKVEMVMEGASFGESLMGLPPTVELWLAMLAEFVCALLVIVGLGTRFAAVPIAITMATAAFVVHGGDPWTMGGGAARFAAGEAESAASREPAMLFLSVFLALVFTGAGRYSLDGLIAGRRGKRAEA